MNSPSAFRLNLMRIAFFRYGMCVPGRNLPSVSSMREDRGSPEDLSFAGGSVCLGRRRPFVSYDRSISTECYDFDVAIIGRISRR